MGFLAKVQWKYYQLKEKNTFFKVKRKLVGQRGEDLIYEGMIYLIIMVSNK